MEAACYNSVVVGTYYSLLFQGVDLHLFSDRCREEFDEEKEPDGMVLSGWSAPVEKQVTSNGVNKSVASSSSAHDTDDINEDISAKPGMKRKLDEILETVLLCLLRTQT